MKSTIASPKASSLKGANVSPIPFRVSMFMRISVTRRRISLSEIINVAPNIDPGMLPSPPIITMARYSTDNHSVNGSAVMLTI